MEEGEEVIGMTGDSGDDGRGRSGSCGDGRGSGRGRGVRLG